ncbi:hypothetical protein TNCV_2042011 [Trichonephila clavipes]|nr:hypothetical protein TNCV_2042011 [Trichonephila clavipes]
MRQENFEPHDDSLEETLRVNEWQRKAVNLLNPTIKKYLNTKKNPSVFMDNAEVTPPLITRCDKGTQTLSPYLHIKRLDLGKRRLEPPLAPKRLKQNPSEGSNNIILWVPRHHPLMALGNNGFIIQPTNVNGINK